MVFCCNFIQLNRVLILSIFLKDARLERLKDQCVAIVKLYLILPSLVSTAIESMTLHSVGHDIYVSHSQ